MQTEYRVNLLKAVKGMPVTAPRKSRALQLPWLPQIQRLTIAGGAGTDNVVITITDRKSGQSWSATATGHGTEATLLANVLAAIRGHAKLNLLFSVADGGTATDVVVDFTARNANREYLIASVGGPSGASAAGVVTELQAEGGSGLEFGVLVARGSADDEFAAMTASTTVRDIAGFLFRTDANHFHSLENDTPDAVDACIRGKHYAIAEHGEFWVEVSEDVTPASRCHVRIEGSDIGDWGDSPAGTAQVLTITPAANLNVYGFTYDYRDASGVVHTVPVVYQPTDATNTAAEAVQGLEDVAAASAPTGITVSAAGGATMTLTAAAGTEIFNVRTTVWGLDAEVTSVTVSLASADVDMLDVSSICRYVTSASAGGLAQVKVNLQP